MNALHEARDKRSALEKQITRRLFAGDIGRYPLRPFAQTGIRLVRALIVSLILLDGFRLDAVGRSTARCSISAPDTGRPSPIRKARFNQLF